jgi:hypothetical protein
MKRAIVLAALPALVLALGAAPTAQAKGGSGKITDAVPPLDSLDRARLHRRPDRRDGTGIHPSATGYTQMASQVSAPE